MEDSGQRKFLLRLNISNRGIPNISNGLLIEVFLIPFNPMFFKYMWSQ